MVSDENKRHNMRWEHSQKHVTFPNITHVGSCISSLQLFISLDQNQMFRNLVGLSRDLFFAIFTSFFRGFLLEITDYSCANN